MNDQVAVKSFDGLGVVVVIQAIIEEEDVRDSTSAVGQLYAWVPQGGRISAVVHEPCMPRRPVSRGGFINLLLSCDEA